jgi:hypothetical protein
MSILAQIKIINTYTVAGTDPIHPAICGTVIIALTDVTTGSPVNGNNIIISYNQITDGTTIAQTATIAGQSQVIYEGIITDVIAGIHNSWAVTGQSDAPDPAPPVNQCDLQINSISIVQPESSAGAADGQISVNATSSYLPITYSLDNVNFQTSNIFTGLHGGAYTFYCTDANTLGCLASSTVTIPITQNLLVSDPSVTTGNNTSRWNAAFNPIVFTYQRKDFEVTSIIRDTATGNTRVNVNAQMGAIQTAIDNNNAVINSAAVQGITLLNYQTIYVYLNAGPYNGVFAVSSADDRSFIITTPYLGTAIGFVNINMLRPYYQIATLITYVDPLTNAINTITSINRPNNQGIIQADISNFLQSLLRVKDGNNYIQINYRDTNLSASYTIQYQEQYDNYQIPGAQITSQMISISTPYYVTYTARQIQTKNGGNMANYVPFPAPSTPAKWLTDFTEPAFTNGYPFDISFIYSEALAGQQLYYDIILQDINRNPLSGGNETSYLLNDDGSWLLNQDASKLIIAAQNLITTPITSQTGLNRININLDLPLNVYYFTIALYYNDTNDNPVQLTQTQSVRVDHAPDINGVYMRWIGLTGSWNYYRFNYNQEISLDVQNATIIKNFVQDWQEQDGVEEVISKDAGQKMKLMAEDLSVSDIKGLQSIKYSPKVQMLINANPIQWQTVVLNTATFSEYETINGQAPFSITFNMPSINIQTQYQVVSIK